MLVAAGCKESRVGPRRFCDGNLAVPKIISLLLETYMELPETHLLDAFISSAIKRMKSEMSPRTKALSNAAI